MISEFERVIQVCVTLFLVRLNEHGDVCDGLGLRAPPGRPGRVDVASATKLLGSVDLGLKIDRDEFPAVAAHEPAWGARGLAA